MRRTPFIRHGLITLGVFVISIGSYSPAAWSDSHLGRPATRLTDLLATDRTLTRATEREKYPSCEALVAAVQTRVYANYNFELAPSLTDDPECSQNPLFAFARDTQAAEERLRAQPASNSTGTRARSRAAVDRQNMARRGAVERAPDSRNVIARLMASVRDKQYGTTTRHLGQFNNALTCASPNSVHVMDLLLAAVIDKSVNSDLPEAERKECLQGAFNMALNTFDQRQHTGQSLIQETITKHHDRVKALLVPGYPVCDLGVFVYDFVTGKLVRLRDDEACKIAKDTTRARSARNGSAARLDRLNRAGRSEAEKPRDPARYLLDFLERFHDPRLLGTENCSLLRIATTGKPCLAGLQCGSPVSSERTGEIAADIAARARDSATLRADIGDISLGIANPRFGLPRGATDRFLCERFGGVTEDPRMGAFGGASDLREDPTRKFFQCQASTLFQNMQDPTTACIVNGMREVMNLGREAEHNPSVVIGGFKDPHCLSGAERKKETRQERRERQWRDNAKKEVDRMAPAGDRSFWDPAAVDALLKHRNAARAAIELGASGMPDDIGQRWTEAMKNIAFKVDNDVHKKTGKYAVPVKVDDKWYIVIDAEIYVNDPASNELAKAVKAAMDYIVAKESNTPKTKEQQEQDKKAKEQEGQPREDEQAQDVGPFEPMSDACSNALARAIKSMRECGNPPRPGNQPWNGITPTGGYRGPDPNLINPGPDGVFLGPSTLLDMSSCLDQYGKDIQELFGTRYGPGGCIPPTTSCNAQRCQSSPANCDWGQWSCSASLCREDKYCCGGVTSSRGGATGPAGTSGNAIECTDGNVWNPATRRCEQANSLCPPGQEIQPGVMKCAPKSGPAPRGPDGDPATTDIIPGGGTPGVPGRDQPPTDPRGGQPGGCPPGERCPR